MLGGTRDGQGVSERQRSEEKCRKVKRTFVVPAFIGRQASLGGMKWCITREYHTRYREFSIHASVGKQSDSNEMLHIEAVHGGRKCTANAHCFV